MYIYKPDGTSESRANCLRCRAPMQAHRRVVGERRGFATCLHCPSPFLLHP